MFGNWKISAASLAAAAMIAALSGSAAAEAQDDVGAAVSRLGELNGVALACRESALAARLRETVIELAPKERGVGESFEQATSASFLAFGQAGGECPDARTLAGQVEAAQQQLRVAVGKKP